MKHRFVLAAILGLVAISPAHSQESVVTVEGALKAYEAKDFAKCADTLTALGRQMSVMPQGSELLYVECLSAAGRTDDAFAYLNEELPNGRIDLDQLKHKDRPGLNKLRATSGWAPLLARASEIEADRQAHIDQPLRQELLARYKKDQAVRQEAIADGNSDAAWKTTIPIDQDNTAWLKTVVAQKGWPTRSLVGEDAAKAAFFLAQHAMDPAFQEKVLGLIETAVQKNEADPSQFAMLKDRVLLHQGKAQLYGTQFNKRSDGALVLSETQDLPHLDARRQTVGLPPIAEYKKEISQMYHLEVK